MKVFIHCFAQWMPEGAYRRTLKAVAEIIDGDLSNLLWDLNIYRFALQKAIDALWDLDALPKKSQLHQMLYPILRSYGFRAHVARNIYNYALALIESAKSNGGSKPMVKRFSARLDYQDAKVDVENGVVRVVLREKQYVLRLRHRREYIERFKNLKWKEVHVKYSSGRLYISIVFEVHYSPYEPKGLISIDVNLKQLTTFSGSEIRRYRTRFVNALSKKARAEELQKKYPRMWRYSSKILNRVRSLHRKSRNIVIDWCWKMTKQIVLRALAKRHAIAVEDLEELVESFNNKEKSVRWKLTRLAYRRLIHSIVSKAVEYNVPVVFVDPRNTSSKCPRCEDKLTYINRLAICCRCGLKMDRDSIGATNIWIGALQAYAGASGSPKSGGGMNNETRETAPIVDEGMKKVFINISR